MDRATVFTKTAKGITQVNQRSASLSKDLMKVLKLIDGKSNFGQLLEKAEVDKGVLEKALNTLTKDGFARIFETRKEEIDPFADSGGAPAPAGGAAGGGGGGGAASAGEDDFDFTKAAPAATQRVIPGAANDVSELVRQQQKVDADRKAKEAAHEQARLKAKAEAESRAKLEAEARARQAAEQAAMEQARKAKEASERARAELDAKLREEEARKQALAAAQAKLAAEQKVKEEEEARKLAELRSKADKEANERARAELEARVREEEAKKKAAAEQAARDAAAQKVKEEEEARKLAELRVKAEREAKALAEARARAEAEAAAMAKAREEAENAAKRQAEDAKQAEVAMKARLKDEIEARIRQEMEDLLRNEMEEKTRDELKKSIMEEAKLAAKAELEERLREEREVIAKAEAEARTRAEHDASARAEEESKKRAEAEARAVAESEARIRAEEETKRLRAEAEAQAIRTRENEARMKAEAEAAAARAKAEAQAAAARVKAEADAQSAKAREAEARAKAEAEAAARERASVEQRVQAERQAKYEAEARAKIEAEESEKRQKALSAQIDAERKAKEEAETRARIEARARETIAEDTRAKVQAELETDMAKRAEIEGKAQAKAYMEAKGKAEAEEDDRLRAEQARKAREIAEVLRTKVTPDNLPPVGDEEFTGTRQRRAPRRKKGALLKTVLFSLVGLIIVGIAAVHIVPMRGLAVKVEKALATWLHDDVAIASTTFRLFPSPHLRIEGVAVGKAYDAKAATGNVNLSLGSLFGDKLAISSVELDNVTLTNDAVRRIPDWGKVEGKSEVGSISSIQLRGVKIDVQPPVDPFNASLQFAPDGTFRGANIVAPIGWSLYLKPGEKGIDLDFNARNWALPLGAPIPVSDIRLKGTWIGTEIIVPEFEADAAEGKVNGTLRVNWAQGVKLESDLSLARVSSKELVAAFTKDIAVNGKLDGNFSFSSEGPSLVELFTTTRAQGKFHVGEGSVSNVDLVAVMQSDAAGTRAGVTKFAELTGEMTSSNRTASYRNINLQGGVLRGNGAIDVGANSNLSGRLNLEIRSQVAQDRGTFSISGTVGRPIIRRGG